MEIKKNKNGRITKQLLALSIVLLVCPVIKIMSADDNSDDGYMIVRSRLADGVTTSADTGSDDDYEYLIIGADADAVSLGSNMSVTPVGADDAVSLGSNVNVPLVGADASSSQQTQNGQPAQSGGTLSRLKAWWSRVTSPAPVVAYAPKPVDEDLYTLVKNTELLIARAEEGSAAKKYAALEKINQAIFLLEVGLRNKNIKTHSKAAPYYTQKIASFKTKADAFSSDEALKAKATRKKVPAVPQRLAYMAMSVDGYLAKIKQSYDAVTAQFEHISSTDSDSDEQVLTGVRKSQNALDFIIRKADRISSDQIQKVIDVNLNPTIAMLDKVTYEQYISSREKKNPLAKTKTFEKERQVYIAIRSQYGDLVKVLENFKKRLAFDVSRNKPVTASELAEAGIVSALMQNAAMQPAIVEEVIVVEEPAVKSRKGVRFNDDAQIDFTHNKADYDRKGMPSNYDEDARTEMDVYNASFEDKMNRYEENVGRPSYTEDEQERKDRKHARAQEIAEMKGAQHAADELAEAQLEPVVEEEIIVVEPTLSRSSSSSRRSSVASPVTPVAGIPTPPPPMPSDFSKPKATFTGLSNTPVAAAPGVIPPAPALPDFSKPMGQARNAVVQTQPSGQSASQNKIVPANAASSPDRKDMFREIRERQPLRHADTNANRPAVSSQSAAGIEALMNKIQRVPSGAKSQSGELTGEWASSPVPSGNLSSQVTQQPSRPVVAAKPAFNRPTSPVNTVSTAGTPAAVQQQPGLVLDKQGLDVLAKRRAATASDSQLLPGGNNDDEDWNTTG